MASPPMLVDRERTDTAGPRAMRSQSKRTIGRAQRKARRSVIGLVRKARCMNVGIIGLRDRQRSPKSVSQSPRWQLSPRDGRFGSVPSHLDALARRSLAVATDITSCKLSREATRGVLAAGQRGN